MFVVSEEWKAAYPDACAGILVMRGLTNPERHVALEARRLAVEAALCERFGAMDRPHVVATAPLDAYSVYFKRFKKTYPVQLQLESIVFKGKHIPSFSSLVTAMFTAELKNQILTAGHDLDSLQLPVTLRVADGTEWFTLITGAEQGVKTGDMYMADTTGIISVVVYGPDQRTRITAATRNALFTAYAPPGVDPSTVRVHLEDIRDNVLLVAPDAVVERLEVHRACP
jgi:DNA/RNA-binding domain of Phe-tRNA-synthetase-like protein